jgi:hypothetical protein
MHATQSKLTQLGEQEAKILPWMIADDILNLLVERMIALASRALSRLTPWYQIPRGDSRPFLSLAIPLLRQAGRPPPQGQRQDAPQSADF